MIPENQQERVARFQRDVVFFEAHHEELLQQYPEEWIAIFKRQVVGHDSELDRLLQRLKQEGIPIEKALIEHLTAEEEVFILHS